MPKPPLKQGSPNDFQTPPEALKPLLPFLKKGMKIWECASGKGNLTKELKKLGFDVVSTDIINGKDFLKYEPNDYDVIITNPPFSLKQEFLERAYQLKKPFAFLLPLTTFESKKRQDLFDENGIEVIMVDKRINFETPNGKGDGSWFATAWFTNGLKIGNQLTFSTLNGALPVDKTFVEITSGDYWFKLHPEKIAGVEVETTSFHFPIQVKGTKDDVLRVTGMTKVQDFPFEYKNHFIEKKETPYGISFIIRQKTTGFLILETSVNQKIDFVKNYIDNITKSKLALAKAKAKAIKIKLQLL